MFSDGVDLAKYVFQISEGKLFISEIEALHGSLADPSKVNASRNILFRSLSRVEVAAFFLRGQD